MTLYNLKKNLKILIENKKVILFVNNVYLFLIKETREGEILIIANANFFIYNNLADLIKEYNNFKFIIY